MQLSYGEFHKIVGGHPSLGNWDVDAAPEMSWSDGDTWRMDVQLPANQQIEFKVRCMHRLALSVRPLLVNEMGTLCASQGHRLLIKDAGPPTTHSKHSS